MVFTMDFTLALITCVVCLIATIAGVRATIIKRTKLTKERLKKIQHDRLVIYGLINEMLIPDTLFFQERVSRIITRMTRLTEKLKRASVLEFVFIESLELEASNLRSDIEVLYSLFKDPNSVFDTEHG